MRVLWRHDWSNLGLATFFELWSFGCGRSRGTFCFVVCFISRNYFVWYVVYSGSGTNWFPTEIDSSNTWQYPLNISTSRNIEKILISCFGILNTTDKISPLGSQRSLKGILESPPSPKQTNKMPMTRILKSRRDSKLIFENSWRIHCHGNRFWRIS